MQHKSEHQVPSSSVLGFPFWEVPLEKYIDAIQNSKAQQVATLESSLCSQFQQSGAHENPLHLIPIKPANYVGRGGGRVKDVLWDSIRDGSP